MPTLLIRFPDGSQQTHDVAGELTIGRAEGNDLILSEGGVSRRHARFFLEGDQLMVEDLGSANGTYVDGEKIEGPTPVGPRAQVVIGDYEIGLKPANARGKSGPKVGGAAAGAPPARKGVPSAGETSALPPVKAARATRQLSAVERKAVAGAGAARARAGGPPGAGGEAEGGAALAKRPAPRAAAPAGPAGPALRGLTGPWANKVYPLRGTVVVGRVAGVQIQLEDESVSRRHAELEKTAEGVVVRDLGSANGTTVNGNPVEGDVLLQEGDVVSFGMIELTYEVGDQAAAAAPTRRGAPGARASGSRRGAAADAGSGGKKKVLLIAGAAVGVLLMAGVVMKVTGGGGDGGGKNVGKNTQPVGPMDPAQEVEGLLAECRSHSITGLGITPNWKRARAACEKARELDPINQAVLAQIQKIELEEECDRHFEEGRKLINLLREEQALEAFGKIKKGCSRYSEVKPKAREAIEVIKKKSKDDCTQYARNGDWEPALARCEKYMTIACQRMPDEEITPPPGFEIFLGNGRPPRKGNYWTPKDPMYRNLLIARQKKDPTMGPWMCPKIDMFDDDLDIVDPFVKVQKQFKDRYPDPLMRSAMELYWKGQAAEAVVKLQRLRTDRQKADLHQQAEDMRLDMAAVENLFKSGAGLLQSSEFDRAAEAFREALVVDEKLMKDLTRSNPSFFRRTAETDMAKACYDGGKHWTDRSDPRRGCKIWKLGFSFYRGNADLNKAVGFCSNKGGAALSNAQSCDDLLAVMDFAVDGDGLKEKVDARKAEWGCE